MKKITNLKGAKALTVKEQKSIHGGTSKRPPTCTNDFDCIRWGQYRYGRCKCNVNSGACYAPSNPGLCRK